MGEVWEQERVVNDNYDNDDHRTIRTIKMKTMQMKTMRTIMTIRTMMALPLRMYIVHPDRVILEICDTDHNHNMHSDPSIRSDMGQHSQFLKCFTNFLFHRMLTHTPKPDPKKHGIYMDVNR